MAYLIIIINNLIFINICQYLVNIGNPNPCLLRWPEPQALFFVCWHALLKKDMFLSFFLCFLVNILSVLEKIEQSGVQVEDVSIIGNLPCETLTCVEASLSDILGLLGESLTVYHCHCAPIARSQVYWLYQHQAPAGLCVEVQCSACYRCMHTMT